MDKQELNKENALAVNNTNINAINLFDEKELAAAEIFFKKIMASDKGGIKSVNDGFAVLMRAKDLNLPFSSCLEHIHIINGKTGVDIHIIKSLLLRAGVVWDTIKDYTPQYQYTDGNTIYNETLLPEYCKRVRTAEEAAKITNDEIVGVYPVKWYTDLNGTVYNEFQISDKCVKALNKQQALNIAKEGKFPVIRIPAQPIDFVTEYKFTRYRVINGREIVTTATSHFSYTEAQQAGLFEKDTYKKYPRILISHRAFTFGAREIASDVIGGVMETTELKIASGVDITAGDIMDVDYQDVSN